MRDNIKILLYECLIRWTERVSCYRNPCFLGCLPVLPGLVVLGIDQYPGDDKCNDLFGRYQPSPYPYVLMREVGCPRLLVCRGTPGLDRPGSCRCDC
jgi:hypothetical protein